jgi:ATP/maltotriose-dependent transcriptional regulator MalT
VLARVAALRRDTDEARELVDAARSVTSQLSESLTQAADYITQALIELAEEKLDAAEQLLRSGYRELEKTGGTRPRASVTAMLARVVHLRGRSEEAAKLTRECEQIAPPDQLDAQLKWRSIRAVTLAESDPGKAERLANEAVALADSTDQPDSQAEVRIDLAEVLRLGGRRREAERELERAIALYGKKGNEIGVSNAARLLSRLREGPGGQLASAPGVPQDRTEGPEADRQQQPDEDEPVAGHEPSSGPAQQ